MMWSRAKPDTANQRWCRRRRRPSLYLMHTNSVSILHSHIQTFHASLELITVIFSTAVTIMKNNPKKGKRNPQLSTVPLKRFYPSSDTCRAACLPCVHSRQSDCLYLRYHCSTSKINYSTTGALLVTECQCYAAWFREPNLRVTVI